MTTDTEQKKLLAYRGRIDRIDTRILELVNERLSIGREIGGIKAKKGAPVTDRSREQTVIEKLFEQNKGPANKDLIRYLYSVIIKATREIQKPKTVSYPGPKTGPAHIAALTCFRHSGRFVEHGLMRDVFLRVEKQQSHYGVVPVENSIEGTVSITLDLLNEYDVHISGEHYETISYDLLSLDGEIRNVRSIAAYMPTVAQCRQFIQSRFEGIPVIETGSDNEAALLAAKDPAVAAVATRQAAAHYELAPVQEKIEDTSRNITRFLVIGKTRREKTGNDKTSIMFAVPHVPGALFKALQPVDDAKLNMLTLESRPSRLHNFSYYFYMDIQGHIEDRKVSETLDKISENAISMRVLGSYPRYEKDIFF